MLAKGKVYITKEELEKLLCLPEGVEIVSVNTGEYNESFEFVVMSAEETIVTVEDVSLSGMRRTSVKSLKKYSDGLNHINEHTNPIKVIEINDNDNLSEDVKINFSNIFDEIIKSANKLK